MTIERGLVLLDNIQKPEMFSQADIGVVEGEFEIFGESVNSRVGFLQREITLSQIVPLARAICDKVTSVVPDKKKDQGEEIPCEKGCSACCYYLVPLSVPEVFRLNEDIFSFSRSRQRVILRACLLAARQMTKRKLPEYFDDIEAMISSSNDAGLSKLSGWYKDFELSCPFLQNKKCSIYEQRPMVCRGHLVKGKSSGCKVEKGTAEVVSTPVKIEEVLSQLTSELENKEQEAIILPLATVWFHENIGRHERSWPAVKVVERLFEIINMHVSESRQARVMQGS